MNARIQSIGCDIVDTQMSNNVLCTAKSYANADSLARRLDAHDDLVAALEQIADKAGKANTANGERIERIARAALAKAAA